MYLLHQKDITSFAISLASMQATDCFCRCQFHIFVMTSQCHETSVIQVVSACLCVRQLGVGFHSKMAIMRYELCTILSTRANNSIVIITNTTAIYMPICKCTVHSTRVAGRVCRSRVCLFKLLNVVVKISN